MENFKSWIDEYIEVSQIRGWLIKEEADFLAACGHAAPNDRAIVEIGAYQGLSTVCLAYGSHRGNMAQIYSVDSHEPLRYSDGGVYGSGDMADFYRCVALSGVSHLIYAVKVPSRAACGLFIAGSLSLLWVDGDHRHPEVINDLLSWVPRVQPGGLVVMHDRHEPGVALAINLRPEVMKIQGMIGNNMAVFSIGEPAEYWPLQNVGPLEENDMTLEKLLAL